MPKGCSGSGGKASNDAAPGTDELNTGGGGGGKVLKSGNGSPAGGGVAGAVALALGSGGSDAVESIDALGESV